MNAIELANKLTALLAILRFPLITSLAQSIEENHDRTRRFSAFYVDFIDRNYPPDGQFQEINLQAFENRKSVL